MAVDDLQADAAWPSVVAGKTPAFLARLGGLGCVALSSAASSSGNDMLTDIPDANLEARLRWRSEV